MNRFLNYLSVFLIAVVLFSCKEDQVDDPVVDPPVDTTTVKGFGIMSKLPGIWNGPVYSPTPLGSYPEWIVDFRPISTAQISAKNELDSLNDIFMSFFVVKHDNEMKIAFRNGGGFAGATRNSYMICDSVSELTNHSYYRFADPVSGGNRVYTEVTFKDDSLIMHTYTNQYNTLSTPVTHMIWKASLRDGTTAASVVTQFGFPKKDMIRDFSTTFNGLSEAIFYSAAQDPYPETEQPHLGNSTINIQITNPATIDNTKKVLIIITAQPLFSGFVFQAANLKYRSRYVFVDAAANTSFNFNYMHPGNYYVNAIYDSNGDYNFSSGDYMNSNFDVPLTLNPEGSAVSNVNINFLIP